MADLYDSFLHALLAFLDADTANLCTIARMPVDCCIQADERGPAACACWEPVYDLAQAEPDRAVTPVTRSRMCGDCAYRPESPEKTGDARYQGDPAELERLAREDRFWCHTGMRQPVAWRHPNGALIPDRHDGNYEPPVIDGVPFKADGTPGELCAGWDARRRALTARQEEDTSV